MPWVTHEMLIRKLGTRNCYVGVRERCKGIVNLGKGTNEVYGQILLPLLSPRIWPVAF